MSIILRAATAADQSTIVRLVRRARLTPWGLAWPNFIVAEDATALRIVGAGQLRPHGPDQELASLVVVEEYQGRGIGAMLIQALIARGRGPLHLVCKGELASYYARFGFGEITRMAEVPRGMRLIVRIGWTLGPLATRLSGRPVRMAVMRHPAPQPDAA